MEPAKRGDRVKVHYTGSLEDGAVFDSSRRGDPLEFTIGGGEVIPGFEDAVIGMTPGESRKQLVPALDAYGLSRPDVSVEVQRTTIPPELDLILGQELQIQDPEGRVSQVVVTAFTDTTITLDGNHPLAGKDLCFQIDLIEILAA